MAFAEKDTKLLWGRAAGICSNPACRQRLTSVGAGGESFLTGEMAHQIAQSPRGPRGGTLPGSDEYDNLILLCAHCHRTIDKAPPGTFAVELLRRWKREHEEWVESLCAAPVYYSAGQMAAGIRSLLRENRAYFDEYGPKSELARLDPGSSVHAVWVARKLDTILPNNRRILNVLDANAALVPISLAEPALRFRLHARGYERNQYERVESYPLFPIEFAEEIESLAQ